MVGDLSDGANQLFEYMNPAERVIALIDALTTERARSSGLQTQLTTVLSELNLERERSRCVCARSMIDCGAGSSAA